MIVFFFFKEKDSVMFKVTKFIFCFNINKKDSKQQLK